MLRCSGMVKMVVAQWNGTVQLNAESLEANAIIWYRICNRDQLIV